jgi:alkylation response protein AidB-like acyl-CoA dehydrogenase
MQNAPAPETLIAAARELAPVLRERASDTEKARRVPAETDRAFREAGFYRTLQPARFGGYEMDYGIQTRLADELGRGCASSAWVMSITAIHAQMLGMFPAEPQDALWDDNPDATVATSFLPRKAEVEAVKGGWRVSGRWGFSSGVDHTQAVLLMLSAPQGDRKTAGFAFFKKDDYAVEDTWYAAGLSGTGSNDIVVTDAFLPEPHFLPAMLTRGGETPGSAVNPGHLFRMPLFAVFPYNLIGPALGAAQGAMDAIVAEMTGRSSVAHQKLAEQQSVQMRIAEASAEVDAARALVMRHLQQINDMARAGESPHMALRTLYRRDLGFAAKMCVSALERVFPLVGGQGLAPGHPIQRAWRDVHAIAQHLGLTWDIQASMYGAVTLGQPCPDPRL